MVSQAQIHKVKILIIDDQKLHTFFLEKILKKEGYDNIYCVTDSRKASAAFYDFRPDIILLDLIMPTVDGFQILEQLKAEREDQYLPVLALSEEKSPEIRHQALQAGVTDFLHKPYESDEVLMRIRNMAHTRILDNQVHNQNKILELKVQERTQELNDSRLEIIRRLAQAAECRDNETGVHIIRMSHYCEKLAETLNLEPRLCELILNASPLHDIGKIGIPDSILLKPGKLTPEEYEVMKTHTTIGARLLAGSGSELMKMAEIIAMTHHEKWDGTGYPKKLKADQIPLIGQVCSVCDVFDALTGERPYKKAWTVESAVEEIVRLKGVNFNPMLVDKFISILPAIRKIKEEHDG